MPGYFSYVGKLDSPGFFWNDIPEDKFRTGNTPDVIPPKGFTLGLGFAPGLIRDWGENHGFEAKQIDWAAWGMIVRKADIEMIWQGEKATTIEKEWTGIWNEIQMLRDDEKYVLIVAENP